MDYPIHIDTKVWNSPFCIGQNFYKMMYLIISVYEDCFYPANRADPDKIGVLLGVHCLQKYPFRGFMSIKD